ncbi:alpha/beta hydrolase [Fibrisoma montanum]|nr:alpha/beta hydrolase [Fibrisoma montanum]
MATVTHYLITNRQIDLIDGREVINPGGRERAVDDARISFRFARYTFDPDNVEDQGTVELVPDLITPPVIEMFSGTILSASDKSPEQLEGKGKARAAEDLSGSNQVFMEVFRTLKDDNAGNVLFFIHGFRSNLAVTLTTIRLLHTRYVKPGSNVQTIITFTWPARRSLLRYLDDQHDARVSGYALARVYQRLHDFLAELFNTTTAKPCHRSIHLLCHSMGNQVLYYMLERLKEQRLSRRETFRQAILMGADVPYDAFEVDHPMNLLIDLCERVHVYYHRRDLALVASSAKFLQNRLGRVGFKRNTSPPLAADVHEIDITDVPSQDTDTFLTNLLEFDQNELIQHWSYLSNETIINDIEQVFRTGRSGLRLISPPYVGPADGE